MKASMENKVTINEVVEPRRVAGVFLVEESRDRIHWLDLAQRNAATSTDLAYDNAACDAETSFSDGQLDQEEKFFSAMDLDKGERTELSSTGSIENLIEDERFEGKNGLEMSSSSGISVQFQAESDEIPKSLIRDDTEDIIHKTTDDTCISIVPQRFLNQKSFENKSFTHDWLTEEAINETGTKGQNGKAGCCVSADEAPANYLDNNSNVQDRMEVEGVKKDGASKGKTETGFRVSLRRILRHFSERKEKSTVGQQREPRYCNGQSASRPQHASLSPLALSSRRQSDGDVRADFVVWPRRSSLQLANRVAGMEEIRRRKTSGHLEAASDTPRIYRPSSITIITYFGNIQDGRSGTDGWANGNLDSIPSVTRDIGGDVGQSVVAGSTTIQIVGSEGVDGSTAVGDVQPAMIGDTGETFFRILLETVLPFLMAGFGCAFAGIVLDIVQHWQVFLEVGELFILVPSLLGLKGNLEMTQASRLSTQANLGHMETTKEQLKLIGASLALTQVQSIVVAFMASIVAILLGWIPAGKFDLLHGILVCTSSVITASIASLVLGSVMVGVVLISRKFRINPDNVATPFGGSLGDLTTITLLSNVAMLLFTVMESHAWVAPVLLCFWLALTPVWWTIANRHSYTRNVLRTGWIPVIGAMAISSAGGLVLDMAVEHFEGIAVFQPVVNGVGGNLVAVQASRLATALHRITVPGVLPANAVHCCPNVITTFFGKGTGSKTARVLMLMVIPGHIIFMFTIEYLKNGCSTLTPTFVVVYVTATVIQVTTLLYVANFIVHWLWGRGNDPDNYSIPYLTAIGDLLGGLLLVAAFSLLTAIGDVNTEPKSG